MLMISRIVDEDIPVGGKSKAGFEEIQANSVPSNKKELRHLP
jgi:hypothetical protein